MLVFGPLRRAGQYRRIVDMVVLSQFDAAMLLQYAYSVVHSLLRTSCLSQGILLDYIEWLILASLLYSLSKFLIRKCATC